MGCKVRCTFVGGGCLTHAARNVLPCTVERVAGHYLADSYSDRHKCQRVFLEFFDSETIDYSSSAALARLLQYPSAKWHIWMFCICPRELYDTNTATLNDTNTATQPCAGHAVKTMDQRLKLNCEPYLWEEVVGVRGNSLGQRWEYSWRWLMGTDIAQFGTKKR
jgi:hypothetical protein